MTDQHVNAVMDTSLPRHLTSANKDSAVASSIDLMEVGECEEKERQYVAEGTKVPEEDLRDDIREGQQTKAETWEEHSTEKVTAPEESSETKDEIQYTSYRDFSRISASDTTGVASLFKAASTKEPTFPAKLHMILSNPEFEDIISWMPHGRSWRILKPEVFEDRILPLFFCHCRLSSFMRQVNGWGFRRAKHGPDYNSYFNELFLRGLPHLVERMRRESVSSKSKGSQEDEPTPDFYKISEENPLPENPPAEYQKTVASRVQANTASGTATASNSGPKAHALVQAPDTALPRQAVGARTDTMFGGMVRSAPNQAELVNAFRNARMMEQQRLVAMDQFGPYSRGPPTAYSAMAIMGISPQDPAMVSLTYGQYGGYGRGALMATNPYVGVASMPQLQLHQGYIPTQYPQPNAGQSSDDAANYDFSNLPGYQLPR